MRYPEWPCGPLWFAQAEAQFFLAGISSETTKFYHVISQLDQCHAAELGYHHLSARTGPLHHTDRADEAAVSLENSASASSLRLRWETTSHPSF